jgi:hypothetical protein
MSLLANESVPVKLYHIALCFNDDRHLGFSGFYGCIY